MCAPMAIGIIGGLVSAMGSIAQANAQAQALKSEAAWKEREASVEQMKTSYEIAQERRRTEASLGQVQVGYAASGIQGGGGTPEQVTQAIVQEREMDVQNRRFQGQEAVNKNLWEAKNLKSQAKQAKTAGMLGAVQGIVGGFSQAFSGSGGTSMVGTAFSTKPGGIATTPTIATVPPAPSVSGGGVVSAAKLNPYGTMSYAGDPRRFRF